MLPANREGFRHRLGEGVSFGKSMVPGTCCQTLYGTNRSMVRSIMIHTQKKSPLTPRNRPNINYEALVRSPSTCNPSLGTDQRGKIYIYAPLTGPREEPKEEPMRHITRGTMEKLDEVKNICSARQVLHQTHKFLEKVRAPIKVRQRWLTQ